MITFVFYYVITVHVNTFSGLQFVQFRIAVYSLFEFYYVSTVLPFLGYSMSILELQYGHFRASALK